MSSSIKGGSSTFSFKKEDSISKQSDIRATVSKGKGSDDSASVEDLTGAISAKVRKLKDSGFKLYIICGKYHSELKLSDEEYKTIVKTHEKVLEILKEQYKDDASISSEIDNIKIKNVDYYHGIVALKIGERVKEFCLDSDLSIFNSIKEVLETRTKVKFQNFPTSYNSNRITTNGPSKYPTSGSLAFNKGSCSQFVENIQPILPGDSNSWLGMFKNILVFPKRKLREGSINRKFCEFQKNAQLILEKEVNEANKVVWTTQKNKTFNRTFDERFKLIKEEFRTEIKKKLGEENTINPNTITYKLSEKMKVIEEKYKIVFDLEQEISQLQQTSENDAKTTEINGKQKELKTEQDNLNDLMREEEYLTLKAKKESLEKQLKEINELDLFALKMVTYISKLVDFNTLNPEKRVELSLKLTEKVMVTLNSDITKLSYEDEKYCAYVASILLKNRFDVRDFTTKFQNKYGRFLNPVAESLEERSKFLEIYLQITEKEENVEIPEDAKKIIKDVIEAECEKSNTF